MSVCFNVCFKLRTREESLQHVICNCGTSQLTFMMFNRWHRVYQATATVRQKSEPFLQTPSRILNYARGAPSVSTISIHRSTALVSRERRGKESRQWAPRRVGAAVSLRRAASGVVCGVTGTPLRLTFDRGVSRSAPADSGAQGRRENCATELRLASGDTG